MIAKTLAKAPCLRLFRTVISLLTALLICVAASPPVLAEQVRMTFGFSLPPWVLADENAGIEIEIAREALAYRGYQLTPVYVPPRRIAHDLINGFVDAASKDQNVPITQDGFYYANEAFIYHAAFFTLDERNLTFDTPENLAGVQILGFQNASAAWPDWLTASEDNGSYKEVVDQALQVRMLQRGRTDVVVADRTIFRHYLKLYEREIGSAAKAVQLHEFAEPSGYAPIFRSEKIRDAFNEGLQHLKDTGRYDEIIAAYVE